VQATAETGVEDDETETDQMTVRCSGRWLPASGFWRLAFEGRSLGGGNLGLACTSGAVSLWECSCQSSQVFPVCRYSLLRC
jgi:hypothetical protein